MRVSFYYRNRQVDNPIYLYSLCNLQGTRDKKKKQILKIPRKKTK